MSDLRTRLIRLAHADPALRPHILPLVSGRVAAEEYSPREATRIYDAFAKEIGRAIGSVSDVAVRGDILVQGPREFTGISVVGDDPKDPQYAVWLHVAPGVTGMTYHVEIRAFKWPGGRGRIRAWETAQKAYDEGQLMGQVLPYITDRIVKDMTRAVKVARTAAWENLPEGWTEESVQSFWDSLTGDVKHKITKCMGQMEGKVTDTGAFCGSLASQVGYRAASASAFDATAMRRAAIRVAHEDPTVRADILASMPVTAAKLPVADLARMMTERVVRGYADEVSMSSGRFIIYDWARANNLEIPRATVDAILDALFEAAVTWGKPKVNVAEMTKVLQQYAGSITPKKSP